jgi:hypothetical protein
MYVHNNIGDNKHVNDKVLVNVKSLLRISNKYW